MVAIAVLSAAAGLACAMFAGRPSRTLVPLVFAVLAVAVSMRIGALAGIAGSLIGAALFASFLFPPIGRLHVEEAAARTELGWMLLAGVSLSYLLSAPAASDEKKQSK